MEEAIAESDPMPMCPMAETCDGMMEKPFFRFALLIPGIVLIVLGVAVLSEPQILVWLVAVALIVMGIAMLLLAKFMRKPGAQFQSRHR